MFKVFVLFFVVFNSYGISLRKNDLAPRSTSHLKRIVEKVKKKDLVKTLRSFVKDTRPSRFVGTRGHEKASTWIVDKIKEFDTEGSGIVVVDSFEPDFDFAKKRYLNDFQNEIVGKYTPASDIYRKWNRFTQNMVVKINSLKGLKGRNIVWEKKGSKYPNETIILGAHYDTLAFDKEQMSIIDRADQPGADNNGTGVAILLRAIEVLSKLNIEKTVRVIFFDFQEIGFLGSRSYISKYKEVLDKENFNGMLNILMLGHDTKMNDKKKKHGNFKAYGRKGQGTFAQRDLALFNMISLPGKKMTYNMKFEFVGNDFNSGDHVSFWDAGHPAVTFTQNWEDDYNAQRHHTSNDFVETLNLNTFYQAYKYILGGVGAWALGLK